MAARKMSGSNISDILRRVCHLSVKNNIPALARFSRVLSGRNSGETGSIRVFEYRGYCETNGRGLPN